jgi:hypothetical protein
VPPTPTVVLGTDPSGRKALIITGTDGDEQLHLEPTNSKNNRFRVTINGTLYGEFDTSKFD